MLLREKGTTMCFRPSAVDTNKNTQMATCPTCGMPVAADEGTTSGQCPYCGDWIPKDQSNDSDNFNPPQHTRIL